MCIRDRFYAGTPVLDKERVSEIRKVVSVPPVSYTHLDVYKRQISIASTLAFSGMTVGMLLKYNIVENAFLLFVIAIGIGALCGLVIGLVIAKGKVLPIIATMGFMYIYRGMAYMIGNSQWASAENLGCLLYTSRCV